MADVCRYHFVVQGTTADGTLYRSEPGTFTIEEGSVPPEGGAEVEVGENLARGATVDEVISEFSPSFAGTLAIDGDEGFITIDLGAPRQLRFEVDDSTGGNVGAVEIRVLAPLG